MNKKEKSKDLIRNNGITLIALVVTIIVLLILAGISINLILGENGIITQAQNAKSRTEISKLKEEAELVKASVLIENLSDITQNSEIDRAILLKALNEQFEGSKLESNKIITANNKYDIIVDEKLNITVLKREESKQGIIITSETVELDSVSKTIKLYFEINGQKSPMEYMYEYIDSVEEGKSAAQLETILENLTAETDDEIVFDDSVRAKFQEMGLEMGMTYEQVLRYFIIMYQGDVLEFQTVIVEAYYNYYCEYLDIEPSNDATTLEAQYVEATQYNGTFEEALSANKEYTKEQAQQEATELGITYELWLKEVIGTAYDERNLINISISTGETIQVSLTQGQYEYTVIENGSYKFTATGPKGEKAETTEEVVIYKGNYNVVADALGITPSIKDNEMMPVKYDSENGEWIEADPSIQGDWFDYSSKKWANVKTKNGDFVYIPRFAYKITSGYHETLDAAGTIAIVFLNEDNTIMSTTDSEGNTVNQSDLITAEEVTSSVSGTAKNATTNYIIHPAFTTFDTEDNKVDGLWVAKYEMSMQTINQESKMLVSKSGVTSWTTKITDMFDNCYNMNRVLDSHMMKNTEWGAVAYLTVSQYGKGNTSEVEQNCSGEFFSYTGYGADGMLSTGAASTTGNMYGIFDMSGGIQDYVAGYLEDTCMEEGGDLYEYCKSLIEADARYKDVYKVGSDNNHNYCYLTNRLKVGDGIWEVSSDVSDEYSWFGDYTYYVGVIYSHHSPVFGRGGGRSSSGTSAGIFYSSGGELYINGAHVIGACRVVYVVN